MRLHVGIDVARLVQDLVAEPLEGLVHAFGRLPGGSEKSHRRAIGLIFLGAQIAEQRILDRRGGPGNGGGAGLAHAGAAAAAGGDHRADAEDHGDDRLRRCRRQLLAQARQVPAGNVTALVRQHADDLVRRVRFHQRAGIDEDAVAVGDESVERAVVDDDGLHVLLGEAGCLEERLRVLLEQLLDLGVADDRPGPLRTRRRACAGERGCGHERDGTRRWRRRPRPDRSLGSGHVRLVSHHFPAQPSGAPRARSTRFRPRFLARPRRWELGAEMRRQRGGIAARRHGLRPCWMRQDG